MSESQEGAAAGSCKARSSADVESARDAIDGVLNETRVARDTRITTPISEKLRSSTNFLRPSSGR